MSGRDRERTPLQLAWQRFRRHRLALASLLVLVLLAAVACAAPLVEAALDQAEGADMLMVKPGMPYLDIIRALHEASPLPIAAYHVSGEYAMMKAAAERGWLDEKESVLETLLCLKRAGATAILTYYGKQAAQWLNEL